MMQARLIKVRAGNAEKTLAVYVSYNMMVDALAPDGQIVGSDDGTCFCAITGATSFPPNVTTSQLLLIADVETCTDLLHADCGLHAISVSGTPRNQLDKDIANRLFLVTGMPFDKVHNKLCALFFSICNWHAQMQRILLDGGGYTELIDSSIPLLDCPIVISGVGLEIIAYTSKKLPKESIVLDAIHKGFFDEEAVEHFRLSGMSSFWDSVEDLTLIEETTRYRNYPIVFYIFRFHGNYYLHMTVHLENREFSDGFKDKLRLLIDMLEAHIHRNPPSDALFERGISSLLSEYAQGLVPPNKKTRNAFKEYGFCTDAPYRLHLFDYAYTDTEHQIAVQTAMDLMNRAPSVLVALVETQVIALEKIQEGSEVFHDATKEHRKRHSCQAAFSDPFTGVENIPHALRQAKAALSVAAKTQHAHDSDALSFTEAFVDYFLTSQTRDPDLVATCLETCIPARLAEHDLQNGLNDFDLLHVYLSCERKASQASNRLYIHRNTLLYRIKHIEKEYGISLDDGATRNRLTIEYHLLETKDPFYRDGHK